jgi:hypothetical protein
MEFLVTFSTQLLSTDEAIFVTIIQEIRFEIFYACPLSNIFHSSFLSSLSSIHQFLLSLQVMKWFSEFYWKSIISGNSLLIEYNKQYQVINNDTFSERKERKVNKLYRFISVVVTLPDPQSASDLCEYHGNSFGL